MDKAKEYTLNFAGDVMLGRLIDQLFPTHVSNREEDQIIRKLRDRGHIPPQQNYTSSSPWGSTLPLFREVEKEEEEEEDVKAEAEAGLNFINLETAITTHSHAWPGKKFNYRMHPANALPVLAAARIDFVCLANNHTLDFGTEGLVETVWTLKKDAILDDDDDTAGDDGDGDGDGGGGGGNGDDEGGRRCKRYRIAFAGAGETTQEAIAPVVLSLPRKTWSDRPNSDRDRSINRDERQRHLPINEIKSDDVKDTDTDTHFIHVYAATDHPHFWSDVPTFHFVDYSQKTRDHLKRITQKFSASTNPKDKKKNSSLKVFSFHWGPNYSWQPTREIRCMAHFLIFECGMDIVHGHSSHHVQGIECPAPGKLIIYGCGDFVDDYALNGEFRNDLGAVYRVIVKEGAEKGEATETDPDTEPPAGDSRKTLTPVRLEIFPLQIVDFQAHLLLLPGTSSTGQQNHDWVVGTITKLTKELVASKCDCEWCHGQIAPKDASIRTELGDRGQLIIDLI